MNMRPHPALRRAAQQSLRELRWLAAGLSPLVGLLFTPVCVIAGSALLNRLCPAEQFISGQCYAPWYRTADTIALSLSFGFGAALFVALPALLAPAFKRQVAALAFVSGLSLVAVAGLSLLSAPPMVAALFGAAVFAVICHRHKSAA